MSLLFTPVIGLEIHVQLATASKIFCSCSTDYIGAVPNTNVCPLCLGLPGTLPVLNAKAVEYGVRASLALNCTVRNATRFHRKNYFYPDLPKAYQISQYDLPLAEHGFINITSEDGTLRPIGITRLHLEEDAGKLVHGTSDGRLTGASQSFVDYNRGGVPLAEIVSEPDLRTPAEARQYVSVIRQLVRYLGVSDGDMEKGSLRVDANISVKCSDGRWGERAEIKNMNSLKALERALEYEIKRHIKMLSEGKIIIQETRHWNDSQGITISSRSKEEAHDYRYFPEPDLPPLVLPDGYVKEQLDKLPELPWDRKRRFKDTYGLSEQDSATLTENRDMADFYENCLISGGSPERTANWLRTEVLRVLNENKMELKDFPISSHIIAEMIVMMDNRKLSNTAAKEVFEHMIENSSDLHSAMSLCDISAGGIAGDQLRDLVSKILEQNNDVVRVIRSGEDLNGKKQKYLKGLVMRETRGQADPSEVSWILASLLENN